MTQPNRYQTTFDRAFQVSDIMGVSTPPAIRPRNTNWLLGVALLLLVVVGGSAAFLHFTNPQATFRTTSSPDFQEVYDEGSAFLQWPHLQLPDIATPPLSLLLSERMLVAFRMCKQYARSISPPDLTYLSSPFLGVFDGYWLASLPRFSTSWAKMRIASVSSPAGYWPVPNIHSRQVLLFPCYLMVSLYQCLAAIVQAALTTIQIVWSLSLSWYFWSAATTAIVYLCYRFKGVRTYVYEASILVMIFLGSSLPIAVFSLAWAIARRCCLVYRRSCAVVSDVTFVFDTACRNAMAPLIRGMSTQGAKTLLHARLCTSCTERARASFKASMPSNPHYQLDEASHPGPCYSFSCASCLSQEHLTPVILYAWGVRRLILNGSALFTGYGSPPPMEGDGGDKRYSKRSGKQTHRREALNHKATSGRKHKTPVFGAQSSEMYNAFLDTMTDSLDAIFGSLDEEVFEDAVDNSLRELDEGTFSAISANALQNKLSEKVEKVFAQNGALLEPISVMWTMLLKFGVESSLSTLTPNEKDDLRSGIYSLTTHSRGYANYVNNVGENLIALIAHKFSTAHEDVDSKIAVDHWNQLTTSAAKGLRKRSTLSEQKVAEVVKSLSLLGVSERAIAEAFITFTKQFVYGKRQCVYTPPPATKRPQLAPDLEASQAAHPLRLPPRETAQLLIELECLIERVPSWLQAFLPPMESDAQRRTEEDVKELLKVGPYVNEETSSKIGPLPRGDPVINPEQRKAVQDMIDEIMTDRNILNARTLAQTVEKDVKAEINEPKGPKPDRTRTAKMESAITAKPPLAATPFVAAYATTQLTTAHGRMRRDDMHEFPIQYVTHLHYEATADHVTECQLTGDGSLSLHPIDAKFPVTFTLLGILGKNPDAIVYGVTGLPEQIAAQVGPQRLGLPVEGENVRLYSCDTGKWKENSGKVLEVRNHLVFVDANTAAGHCRTPYINSKGQVVGNHKYGMTTTAKGAANAGEVDIAHGLKKYIPGKISAASFFEQDAADPPALQGPKGKPKRYRLKPNKMELGKYCSGPSWAPLGISTESAAECVALPQKGQTFAEQTGLHVVPVRFATPTTDLNGKWWTMAPHAPEEFDLTHRYGKPPFALTIKETAKFGEKLTDWPHSWTDTDQAFDAVISDDLHYSRPAPRGNPVDRFYEAIRFLNKGSSVGYCEMEDVDGNTVHGQRCQTQQDFIELLGLGDRERGASHLARSMARYLDEVMQDPQGMAARVYWKLQSKRDKYPLTKLDKARGVQAPPIHFKLLWLYFFAESDVAWNQDITSDNYVRVNPNAMLQVRVEHEAEDSYGATSTDLTGWDRRINQGLLFRFFGRYCSRMCVGIPPEVLIFMAMTTVFTNMVFPDGSVCQKDHGNPSGFPNTIRLNCVIHKACNKLAQVAAYRTLEGRYDIPWSAIELFLRRIIRCLYCGDDGLNFAKDSYGLAILDQALIEWSNMPWVIKPEGRVVFDKGLGAGAICELPSFVSRVVRNLGTEDCPMYYHVLDKPYKCVTTVAMQPGNDSPGNLAERVRGVETSLVHHIVMHGKKLIDSDVVKWLHSRFNTLAPARVAELERMLGA